MSLVSRAKEHLAENKMTYASHFVFATTHGLRCLKAGIYLVVHGLMPCFYRHAGSNLVRDLNKVFTDWRERNSSDSPEAGMD